MIWFQKLSTVDRFVVPSKDTTSLEKAIFKVKLKSSHLRCQLKHAETNQTLSAITASGYGHHHIKDTVGSRVGYGKLLAPPGVRKGPELQSLEGAELLAKSDELKDAAASIFKAGRRSGHHGRLQGFLTGVSLKLRLSLSWLKIMMNHDESWMIPAIGDTERTESSLRPAALGNANNQWSWPTASGLVGLWSHRWLTQALLWLQKFTEGSAGSLKLNSTLDLDFMIERFLFRP